MRVPRQLVSVKGMDREKVHRQRPLLVYLVVAGGLLLAYLPNYIGGVLRELGVELPFRGPAQVIVWNWLAVALLALYIFGVEKKNFASIRLVKPSEKDVSWAFYFWGVAMAWYWLASLIVPPEESAGTGTGVLISLGLPVVILMVITAAFTEEFLWRGYVVERLGELTGKIWIGAAISFVIFVIPHVAFFGPQWLVHHAMGSILIYVLYLWRRNLWSTILLHFLVNVPIVIPTIMAMF